MEPLGQNGEKQKGFEGKPAMTCRIDRLVIGEDLVILRISGRISGSDVDMVRTLLEQERSVVSIDLKNVLIVAREAVQLLALLESRGTELRNCPAYIREWVTRERADTNGLERDKKEGEGIEDAGRES